ncbi:BrnT family toxin [Methylobacter svalbardensis]|uniref:BrnT family toxin n=1 Tax=Methylobacter svalbardensis TaxID=3080016 RepID=UPI0030EF8835
MEKKLTWDETKRQTNLQKHGLDFADAGEVLNSRYRLDLMVERNGEQRLQSFSYVMNRLAVLSLVHLDRNNTVRVVSFRPASQLESEMYYEWLENNVNES